MEKISIGFSRYSAFYSPLITTIACGFLKDEGLAPEYKIATADYSAFAMIQDGAVDVTQSAVSASWAPMEKGGEPPVKHFAQINLKDGFFIIAKEPDPDFSWDKLAGKRMIVDHGGQPLAMFKYACHCEGLDYSAIDAIDLGGSDAMEAGFRAGRADYAHFQGPAPQQLEEDGVGYVVASVGEAIGPVAFSSLAAAPGWTETDQAKAFMRAYRKARQFCIDTPAAEIAKIEDGYFAGIGQPALTKCIEAYHDLGNWDPAVEISEQSYATALDVFEHCGLITKRHDYATVVAPPPLT